MAFPQGATFVFGSWVCVANGSGGFDSHLTNPIEPEVISSESHNAIVGSDDRDDMLLLLPDLARETEQKLDTNSSYTQNSDWSQPEFL